AHGALARGASGTGDQLRHRRRPSQHRAQVSGLAGARGLQPAGARRAGRVRRSVTLTPTLSQGRGSTAVTWLIAGVRTPFARADGPLRKRDAIGLSVPVAESMARQLRPSDRPDLVVWGTVMQSLAVSNIARELVIDAHLDPSTPAFSTVLACSTSMVAVFEAAGMLRDGLDLALCGGVESMSRVQLGLTQGLSDVIRRASQARSVGERID